MKSIFEKRNAKIRLLETSIHDFIYEVENNTLLTKEQKESIISKIERQREIVKKLRRENENQIKNIDDSVEILRKREEKSKEKFDKYFKKCEPKFKALSWILYISALNVIWIHYAKNSFQIGNGNNFLLHDKFEIFNKIFYTLFLFISFPCFIYHSSIFNILSMNYLEFRLGPVRS